MSAGEGAVVGLSEDQPQTQEEILLYESLEGAVEKVEFGTGSRSGGGTHSPQLTPLQVGSRLARLCSMLTLIIREVGRLDARLYFYYIIV